MLLVPSFIFILPILIIFLIINNKKSISIILFILGLFLILFPWSYRNSIIFNQPVFISTNGGVNLLLGNSEDTKYNSGTMVNLDKYYQYVKDNNLNEAEEDNYYKKEAILWIIKNPNIAINLYSAKLLNYFSAINKVATSNQNSTLKDLIAYISYYPILLLAFIRILLYKRFKFSNLEKLFYSIYIFNAFMTAIFFTRVRFRIPFDFLLIALASYSIFYLKIMYINLTKKYF
jgi:hypothetical protein